MAIAQTWLTVVLPIAGLAFGIFGIARDRHNGLAVVATTVSLLGLMIAGLIVAVLMG